MPSGAANRVEKLKCRETNAGSEREGHSLPNCNLSVRDLLAGFMDGGAFLCVVRSAFLSPYLKSQNLLYCCCPH